MELEEFFRKPTTNGSVFVMLFLMTIMLLGMMLVIYYAPTYFFNVPLR